MDHSNKIISVGKIVGSNTIHVALNTFFSLTLIRLLSLDEYSFFVIITTYVSIVVTCSDMGISQSLVSIGAIEKSNASFQLTISKIGIKIRNSIFSIIFFIFFLYLYYVNNNRANNFKVETILISVLVLAYLQGIVQIKKSIYIINYNTRITFKIGLFESLTKIFFLPVCFLYPTHQSALLGLLFSSVSTFYYVRSLTKDVNVGVYNINAEEEIFKFIKPLIPVVLFSVIQGNLGVIYLDAMNDRDSVAQFGALSRISMLFGSLLVLTSHVLHPFFANIGSLTKFKNNIFKFSLLFLIFTIFVLTTVYFCPRIWLFILGKKYYNLQYELILVSLNAIINLMGASFYTILISRKFTSGQSYFIPLGIVVYVVFLFFFNNIKLADILLLNICISLSYLLLQLWLLRKFVNDGF